MPRCGSNEAQPGSDGCARLFSRTFWIRAGSPHTQAIQGRTHRLPLTRSDVRPSSKLTSATNASVHTLVSLPNLRGLSCNSARNCSSCSAPKACRGVWGRLEPFRNASTPRRLNALIASVTVSASQPRSAAMYEANLPRLLASTIWLRRSVNACEERGPASAASRPSLFSVYTNIGFLKDSINHTAS